ncbi:hypothetical protein EVAR_28673_1 [Eumeta japonica]|uniref:Uncharacterized protein n=1 Tax=Eumeta variegata TaxID=151549 RepID=A0A4C1V3Y7_EUMVA|nr:hypothetical protein EVAR_28673_1 [Eumeta japonica]
MERAASAAPRDELNRGPCLFEAPLGSRSKTFSGLSATLAAHNASCYAVKAFGLLQQEPTPFVLFHLRNAFQQKGKRDLD